MLKSWKYVTVCACRSVNEDQDGDSTTVRISSVSGANRKRRREEEEEEEEESEEEDDESSGSSSEEEEEEKTPEEIPTEEPQVLREEVKHKETDVTEEKKEEDCKPAVFIPVDRLPEIQVQDPDWV